MKGVSFFKKIRNFSRYLSLLIVIGLLYEQIIYWNISPIGWFLFLFFIFFTGSLWADIFSRLYGLEVRFFSSKIIGYLSAFMLLGLVAGSFVVLNRLSILNIFLCYLVAGMLTMFLHLSSICCKRVKHTGLGQGSTPRFVIFSGRSIYLLAYFIFYFICVYLLQTSRGNVSLWFSPWQNIHELFLPTFFVLSVVLAILLLSKIKNGFLLFILVLHSLLLHFYIPLAGSMPVGGDVWRHIANEEILISGDYIYPVLFGEKLHVKDFGRFSLPQVIFSPQKFSYAHLWGTNALISRTTGVNLVTLHKYLVPIIWSLGITILMYLIGSLIMRSKQRGLWLAGLSMFPFSLQALGAITLPVSLDLVLFLLIFWLWLKYLQKRKKTQLIPIILFSIFLCFSYWLYFLLFILLVLYSLIGFLIEKEFAGWFKKLIIGIVTLLTFLFLPIVETIGGYARLSQTIDIFSTFKQIIGQFSGWFFASAIRTHDILSGNLFFNHTPDYAFVSNIFTNFRWHFMLIMPIIGLLVLLGASRAVRSEKAGLLSILWLFSTIIGGYLIGWFVMVGDRLLTRRLDGIFVVMLLIFLLIGLNWIIVRRKMFFKIHFPGFLTKGITFLFLLLFSWGMTTSYASGPDLRTLSKLEYEVGKVIADDIDITAPACVLADTWPLLSLEANTYGKIIGGGFPIDSQFAQPERVELLQKAINNPNEIAWEEIYNLTGASTCYLATDISTYNVDYQIELITLYSTPMFNSNEYVIWKIDLISFDN